LARRLALEGATQGSIGYAAVPSVEGEIPRDCFAIRRKPSETIHANASVKAKDTIIPVRNRETDEVLFLNFIII
jgi:hypothetical protein